MVHRTTLERVAGTLAAAGTRCANFNKRASETHQAKVKNENSTKMTPGRLGEDPGLSTRRNAPVSTRDPVVGPNGVKRTAENPEHPPYKAPYQLGPCHPGPRDSPSLAGLVGRVRDYF